MTRLKTAWLSIKIAMVAGGIISLTIGHKIPFSDQLEIYHSLRDFSAIVFGVIGIWLAIVFTEDLGKVFSSTSKKQAIQNATRIQGLLYALIVSTGIVILVVLVDFFSPAVKACFTWDWTRSSLKSISYLLLYLMTIAELWCLFMGLVPTLNLREKLNGKYTELHNKDRFAPNPRKKP
jgi:hypothetical protein